VSATERRLVGNRLALVGAVVYLLEWVAIVAGNPQGPVDAGTKAAAMVEKYAAHAHGQAWLAGWLSVVLLGRIVFAVGVRAALRQSPRQLPLADVAVAAMAVSVILEIAAYAVAGAAGWLARHGGDATAVTALDRAGGWLDQMIYGPIGISVGTMSLAMLGSRLFPRWMCWLGLAAGFAGTVYGGVSGLEYGAHGGLHGAGQALNVLGVVGFWIWMLAVGILLFRRAGPGDDLVARAH
jgi:hypothetical protein